MAFHNHKWCCLGLDTEPSTCELLMDTHQPVLDHGDHRPQQHWVSEHGHQSLTMVTTATLSEWTWSPVQGMVTSPWPRWPQTTAALTEWTWSPVQGMVTHQSLTTVTTATLSEWTWSPVQSLTTVTTATLSEWTWSPVLLVSLSTSDYDIDPDPKYLGTRSYQVHTVRMCLDTEREMWCWTANWSEVIEEHVDDVTERHTVFGTSTHSWVRSATVPAQCSMCAVKQEPASVPDVYNSTTSHLGQSTLTRGGTELDWGRVVFDAVSRGLDELTQVERWVTHRQVASQRPTLHTQTHIHSLI